MRQSRGIEAPLNYADEFKPYGLLDRFYMIMEKGHPIDLRNVLRELLMQDSMATILNHIEISEIKVRVQKYDGANFILELFECKFTFGQIYAYMEGIKDRFNIKEYSCKQSSLEEIFNSHATMSMYMELNKRLERRRTTSSGTRSLQS